MIYSLKKTLRNIECSSSISSAGKASLTISQARSKKWKAMKNKTTLRLSPNEDSFKQHLLRANYQAEIWYNFANPDASSNPLDHGYTQGLLVIPTPHTKEACPNSPRDLVHDETFESDNDKSDDDGDSLCYSSSSDDD